MKIEKLFEKTDKTGSHAYVVYTLGTDEWGRKYLDTFVDSLESFIEFFELEFGHERLSALLDTNGRKVKNDNSYRFWYAYNGMDEMVEIRS